MSDSKIIGTKQTQHLESRKEMEERPKLLHLLTSLIDKKCGNFFSYIDIQIARNLKQSNVEMRPVNSNGIWCCILLPTILIFNTLINKVSTVYCLVACISLALLCYGSLFVIFISVSTSVLEESFYSGFMASSLVSTLTMYIFIEQDLTFSLTFSLLSVYSYDYILRQCITKCPKTFTIGEAMVVSQSILLYGAMLVAHLVVYDEKISLNSIVINTVLATVALIVAAIYFMPEPHRREIRSFSYVLALGIIFVLSVLHLFLGFDCVPVLVNYVFFNSVRLKLFALWLILVVIAICALLVRTHLAVKADTVTRKTFHVLASAVFLSGILADIDLITLAAGVGLAVLILIEILRKSDIEPISAPLQSAFLVYCDEKDCGLFAMTPLYLYCGLACPLLLVPEHEHGQLELLSGVLSIGIGDTAASWFGSCYGFNKWPGTNKSMEGTTFNILSQILTVYMLQLFDLLNANHALIRTAVASIISGLVEATTEQVDNLVLPLVMLVSFQITFFLR